MQYLDKYLELKTLIKKMNKKNYFNDFDSKHLFYLFDEKTHGVCVFSKHLLNDSFGVQLFLGNSGLNYLHDVFTSTNGFAINHFFSNTIILSFVKKNELTSEDVDFLKKNNLRIMPLSFIPYRLKEGYEIEYLSAKEMELVLNYLYCLSSIIGNERVDIDEAFKNNKMVIGGFSAKDCLYDIRYERIINLENFPKNKPINKPFVSEYADSIYVNDTCYITHAYIPCQTSGKYFPSLLLAYYANSEESHYEILEVKPNQFGEYIYGFLDEIFKNYGLPTNIVINNRSLYASVYKTLSALNIEVEFERETEEVDDLIYDIIGEQLEKLMKDDDTEGGETFVS